jgi:hypothetical protein
MSVTRSADGRRPGLGVALAVIATAQLMVVLDATIVNVALPHIQRALGSSGNGLEWVINAYALSFGGLMLLGGRAGDLLGRRRVFISGLLLFYLGGLLGPMLVTGVGLGLLFVPLSLVALNRVPARDSGLASSLLNTGQQVGGAIGACRARDRGLDRGRQQCSQPGNPCGGRRPVRPRSAERAGAGPRSTDGERPAGLGYSGRIRRVPARTVSFSATRRRGNGRSWRPRTDHRR